MNKERLLQLAEHLENGELGHEVFDFSYVNITIDPDLGHLKPKGCGTNGCAMGELPIIWPKVFKFSDYDICFRGTSTYGDEAVMEWFELSEDDVDFLFYPTYLDISATKEQVAAHIRKFVENGGIYE